MGTSYIKENFYIPEDFVPTWDDFKKLIKLDPKFDVKKIDGNKSRKSRLSQAIRYCVGAYVKKYKALRVLESERKKVTTEKEIQNEEEAEEYEDVETNEDEGEE